MEVDSNDAMTEWWTTSDDQDSEAEIAERLDDLLAAVQFEQCETVIIVGHSLLWRELVMCVCVCVYNMYVCVCVFVCVLSINTRTHIRICITTCTYTHTYIMCV